MIIGVPKETLPGEKRAPLIPSMAGKLVKLGAEVEIEAGMGLASGFEDAEYTKVGATINSARAQLIAKADLLLRVRKPSNEEIGLMKKGAIHVSYLDPFNETELVQNLADAQITAISMEMIPRSTRAQKMDALSSQANLAGYVTVIQAAEFLDGIFPMMMTPAGTISPARVFIIGAGVAGLQAIATAKRLGARVEAFDTRPVVAEQVQSLGAKFVDIDLGDTGQTKDGYAKALTEDQLELQRLGMKKVMSGADVVITTAQVFGRPAPRIVTEDMVAAMKPGSVIVDMAVETGGNVAGSELDKAVNLNGVTILGMGNLPAKVCRNASQMYSSNLFNLVSEFWDKDSNQFVVDLDDDIQKGCVMTHGGDIVNETIKNLKVGA